GVVDCPDEYGHLFAVCDEFRCEVGVDRGHHCLAPNRFAHGHAPGSLSHFCLQRRTEVPPYTSTDSVQLANSSVFVGEEEISPGTFAAQARSRMLRMRS